MKLNLIPITLLLFWSPIDGQNLVYLEADEFGRGVLKSRPGECFIITPAHVVKDGNNSIVITGNKNVKSDGELEYTTSPDLAIVRITGGGAQDCADWGVAANFDEIVANTNMAFLEYKENDGSSTVVPVFVTGKDEESITIVPQRNNTTFAKGMSGASLFTQHLGVKTYLGMLQEIFEDGAGYVYQADNMERILGEFFEHKESSPKRSSTKKQIEEMPAGDVSLEEKGVRMDILSVKKVGNKVQCKMKLTALEQDKEITLYGKRNTLMYNQHGVETHATNIKVASQGGNESSIKYTLIQGVPVNAMIEFDNIPVKSTGIAFLKIRMNIDGNIDFKFKHISFQSLTTPLFIPKLDKSALSLEERGIKMDILSVEKIGNKVQCKMKLTALEQDKVVTLYGKRNTIMHNQNGIECQATNIKMTSKGGNESSIKHLLIQGVPVDAMVEFGNIPTNSSGIAYLKIRMNIDGNVDFKFKHISFEGLSIPLIIPEVEKSELSSEERGIRMDILSVEKVGSKVRCNLQLMALEKDQELTFYGKRNTTMHNQNGIECQATNIKIANKGGNESSVKHLLIQGVPVAGAIEFDNIPASSTDISYLKIRMNINGNIEFKFKNISL